MNTLFFVNSILLGVGLAMDAFSVSCANALRQPQMRLPAMARIAGVYAGFQFLMPMTGWVCVHTVKEHFTAIQDYIPWIALLLLVWIGSKMLLDGIRGHRQAEAECQEGLEKEEGASSGGAAAPLSAGLLLVQGLATSIDALSVGFTIADYGMAMALTACLIIGAVTFAVCMGGLEIGKKAGRRLTGKADLLGGVILIAIGLEIVLTHYF